MLSDLLKSPGLVLVLVGAVLLLGASGTITSELLGFTPEEETPEWTRFVLMAAGTVLVVGGLGDVLVAQGNYSASAQWTQLVLSNALILGIALVLSQAVHGGRGNSADLFRRWVATYEGFDTSLDTRTLSKFRTSHDLLLACRIKNDSVPAERDDQLALSKPYPLEGTAQTLRVEFGDEFKRRLSQQSIVQCSAVLLDKQLPSDFQFTHLRELDSSAFGRRIEGAVEARLSECTGRPRGPARQPTPAADQSRSQGEFHVES